MTRVLRLTLLALWAFVATCATASADRLEDAEAAIRANQPEQAGQLLRGYVPPTEMQRIRALWVLALAEMAAGRAENAAPLLEQLVIAAPNDTTVRVQLARAYLALGRDEPARKQLAAAQAGRLSADEQLATDAYLHQISTRKASETYLNFAIVPESNAVRRTAASTIDIGQYRFTLNPSARAKSGVGVQLGFGHTLLPRMSDTLRGRFGLSVESKLFRDRDIREATLTAEAGLEKTTNGRDLLGFGLLGQVRFLGGDRYTHGRGAYASYIRGIGNRGRLSLRAELMDLTYPGYAGASGVRSSITLGYRHAVSPSLVATGDLYLSRMAANFARESGVNGTLSLGLEKAFDGGFVLAGHVARGFLRRNGPTALFPVSRKDKTSIISLRAYHSALRFKGFSPTVEFSYERQKSNIVLNDFSNARVSLGLSRRF
jgi:outer membrane protein